MIISYQCCYWFSSFWFLLQLRMLTNEPRFTISWRNILYTFKTIWKLRNQLNCKIHSSKLSVIPMDSWVILSFYENIGNFTSKYTGSPDFLEILLKIFRKIKVAPGLKNKKIRSFQNSQRLIKFESFWKKKGDTLIINYHNLSRLEKQEENPITNFQEWVVKKS